MSRLTPIKADAGRTSPASLALPRRRDALLASLAALGLVGCAAVRMETVNRQFREASDHQAEAMRLYGEGRYQEGLAASTKGLETFRRADEACASEPGCVHQNRNQALCRIHASRAALRMGLGDYPGAIEEARAAIAENGDDPSGHHSLILAYLIGGKRDSARAELEKLRLLEQGGATKGEPLLKVDLKYLGTLVDDPSAAEKLEKQFHDLTPFARGMTAYQAENYSLAYQLWHALAEKGDAEAQHNVGVLYSRGEGVKADEAEAFRWFLLSAKQGNTSAMREVGTCYRLGRGVERDAGKGIEWLQAAAEKGDADAEFTLGALLLEGEDVEKDERAALTWFRRAAEHGHDRAKYVLGLLYLSGDFGNPKEGAKWMRQAADAGDVDAQVQLGLAYQRGNGVPVSAGDAATWYLRAVAQGHSMAMTRLGRLDASFAGKRNPLKQRHREMFEAYRREAEKDDAVAQYFLGEMYRDGHGVAADAVRAYMWLSLAEPRLQSTPTRASPSASSNESLEDLGPEAEMMGAFFGFLAGAGAVKEDNPPTRLDAAIGASLIKGRLTAAQVRRAEEMAASWRRDHPPAKE